MTGGPALASKMAPDTARTSSPAPRGRAVPNDEAGQRLLDVRGVTMRYKTQAHLITATYRVSFSVLQGDRFVVVGPSGCGKSTLLIRHKTTPHSKVMNEFLGHLGRIVAAEPGQ